MLAWSESVVLIAQQNSINSSDTLLQFYLESNLVRTLRVLLEVKCEGGQHTCKVRRRAGFKARVMLAPRNGKWSSPVRESEIGCERCQRTHRQFYVFHPMRFAPQLSISKYI